MTTHDDLLRPLLEVPDAADVGIFCDWLEDHGRFTWDHLLRLVLEHPDRDGPRLAAARWCEVNGQSERGEFIRVQVELVRMQARHDHECTSTTRRDLESGPLRRRERELLTSEAYWDWMPPGSWSNYRVLDGSIQRQQLYEVQWFRGFVHKIELTTEDFLQHAEAIFRAQPVVSVRLVDREPYMAEGEDIPLTWFPDGADRWQDNPAYLPSAIYCRLAKGTPGPVEQQFYWMEYHTREDAFADLSPACASLGRDLAGLPPLPPGA